MENSPRRQQFSLEYNGTKYDCERIIRGTHVFRQTIQVCGVGSQEDEVEYASQHHNVATMASTAHVIAGEIIEASLENIERERVGNRETPPLFVVYKRLAHGRPPPTTLDEIVEPEIIDAGKRGDPDTPFGDCQGAHVVWSEGDRSGKNTSLPFVRVRMRALLLSSVEITADTP